MGTKKVNLSDPNIISAFNGSLLHQLVLLALFAVALLVGVFGYYLWKNPGSSPRATIRQIGFEPAARKFLRYAFGGLWILDGLLQLQPQMPLGIPTAIVSPLLSGEPSWLRSILTLGIDVWERHPIQAADSLVWIQVGIGIWLVAANGSGRWSRLAGAVSAIWALSVWVGGEAMGGIFLPGASWYFGAPGAVAFYGVAGVLIAMPTTVFSSARAAKQLMRGMGGLMAIFAVVQAFPGRGFWSGSAIAGMAQGMAQSSQPGFATGIQNAIASFANAGGDLTNAILVALLAGAAITLLAAKPTRGLLVWNIALAAVSWIGIQDFGFFGGVGTDPNAALPVLFLVIGFYVWAKRLDPQVALSPRAERRAERVAQRSGQGSVLSELLPMPTHVIRWIPIVVAVAITAVGSGPLAYASLTSHTASLVTAEAIDGLPSPVHYPAPLFTLTDQNGKTFSLSSLQGKVVFLTFLDPVCTTDCPIIASEIRQADAKLSPAQRQKVEFLAVAANRQFYSQEAVKLFSQREGLESFSNWHFMTGSLPALESTWRAYGEVVSIVPAGQMALHGDVAEIIDGAGNVRWIEFTDPGAGTAATEASFAQMFFQYLNQTVATNG
jgi:cytochrome oxidase Cu insertion factor (SCO1/SenC/PrrC family)